MNEIDIIRTIQKWKNKNPDIYEELKKLNEKGYLLEEQYYVVFNKSSGKEALTVLLAEYCKDMYPDYEITDYESPIALTASKGDCTVDLYISFETESIISDEYEEMTEIEDEYATYNFIHSLFGY